MTAYRTRWPESKVLDYFYMAARDADVDRIALLRQVADVKVVRVLHMNSEEVRAWSKEERTGLKMGMACCFGCWNRDRPRVWHHVIQVQHGGSPHPSNQVQLCGDCHARVHPWLVAKRSIAAGGWTSAAQLIVLNWPRLEAILGVSQARRAGQQGDSA